MSTDFLVADKVSVSLGERRVVRDISFALPSGRLAALVGPNGAGKTTLLRALAGLVPAHGTVRVGGHTVARLSVSERALKFAYLPQGHAVHWPLPARDIVALGRYPHGATDPSRLGARDAQAVEQAMAVTDVAAFAGRRVTELSGGELSRVALARVMATQAPVILADEPVAALDPRHQIDVMRLLRQAADGGTLVIVVTHDLGLAARFADTVLVLRDGRLTVAAPPAEAFAPGMLSEVFRVGAYRASHEGKPILVPWTTS